MNELLQTLNNPTKLKLQKNQSSTKSSNRLVLIQPLNFSTAQLTTCCIKWRRRVFETWLHPRCLSHPFNTTKRCWSWGCLGMRCLKSTLINECYERKSLKSNRAKLQAKLDRHSGLTNRWFSRWSVGVHDAHFYSYFLTPLHFSVPIYTHFRIWTRSYRLIIKSTHRPGAHVCLFPSLLVELIKLIQF